MAAFNTIHVFGFGDTQLIAKEKSGTVKSATLTKLQAFIDHVKTFKPADVVAAEAHVIHVVGDRDVRYLGRTENREDKGSYSVKITELNTTIYNDFVNELVAAVAALPAPVQE